MDHKIARDPRPSQRERISAPQLEATEARASGVAQPKRCRTALEVSCEGSGTRTHTYLRTAVSMRYACTQSWYMQLILLACCAFYCPRVLGVSRTAKHLVLQG